MNKAIIKTSYECNNNCIFCHSSEHKQIKPMPLLEIKKRLQQIKPYAGMVLFSGGEVTIRKDFLKIVQLVKEENLDFGLVTNSRMLSNAALCRKLYDSELRYVYTSIHSSNEDLHNRIARSDSFLQTLKGIRNVLKLDGVECIVNIVVNTLNMRHLKGIVDLAVNEGIPVLKFSNAFPKGSASLNKQIIPKLSECWEFVKEAVEYSIAKGIDTRIDCFPECISKEYSRLKDNLWTNSIFWMSEAFEDDFFPTDEGDMEYCDTCAACSRKNRCSGINKKYAEIFGDGEFKAIYSPAANSFNYFMESENSPFSGKRTHETPREINVELDGEIKNFRTETKDFNESSIRKIKSLQQIYLNTSKSKNSNDFSSDYKKLFFDPDSGVYKISDSDIFEADDNAVRDALSEIKGGVLDIGCGEIRYTSIILDKIKSNEISYTGIDPDKDSIKKAKKKIEGAEVIQTSFEEFKTAKLFDFILLLRSLNHFKDIHSTIEKCFFLLKEGGRIIACDNAPFGVIQASLNEENGDETENRQHYHCLFSEDVARTIKDIGLDVKFRKDISVDSSNQWVLVMEKAGNEKNTAH